MREKLWGDWFFDAKAKKWTSEQIAADGSTLKRAFCQFIIDPIVKLFSNCMMGKTEAAKKMCTSLGVDLNKEEWELTEKKLVKCIMQKWVNMADAVMEMMILNLPNPREAQAIRTENL